MHTAGAITGTTTSINEFIYMAPGSSGKLVSIIVSEGCNMLCTVCSKVHRRTMTIQLVDRQCSAPELDAAFASHYKRVVCDEPLTCQRYYKFSAVCLNKPLSLSTEAPAESLSHQVDFLILRMHTNLINVKESDG